jgi:hypothetical protein
MPGPEPAVNRIATKAESQSATVTNPATSLALAPTVVSTATRPFLCTRTNTHYSGTEFISDGETAVKRESDVAFREPPTARSQAARTNSALPRPIRSTSGIGSQTPAKFF